MLTKRNIRIMWDKYLSKPLKHFKRNGLAQYKRDYFSEREYYDFKKPSLIKSEITRIPVPNFHFNFAYLA